MQGKSLKLKKLKRKKGYMRILKDLWDDVGYVDLGLSARDHAAAITDENSQVSVRGESSTALDKTEEVGASMLSQTEDLEPAQCEGENLLNVNVVEGSNLHIFSDIADQIAPQGRTAICKDQNTKNQIKPNLPDYDVLPSETKTKLGAVLVTHVSVILSTMFTMKSSTTGGIYSMFHRVAQGRVSLKN